MTDTAAPLAASVKMARGLGLRVIDMSVVQLDAFLDERTKAQARIAELETKLRAALRTVSAASVMGDESRYYQWATEDALGRRTVKAEAIARSDAAKSGGVLKVVRREIRQFVGHWESAPAGGES